MSKLKKNNEGVRENTYTPESVIHIDYETAESEEIESYSDCYHCPICDDAESFSISSNYNFCPYCGHKIEWINNPGKEIVWTDLLLRELITLDSELKMHDAGYTLVADGVITSEEIKEMRSKVDYYRSHLRPLFQDFKDYKAIHGELQLDCPEKLDRPIMLG